MKQDEIDKIERYINGKADESERKYIESLFHEGENNLYLRNSIRKEWEFFLSEASPTEINLNHLLDRVHHLIRKQETSKRHQPVQRLIRIYKRAAAVLLIPLLVTGAFVISYSGFKTKTANDSQVSATIYAPMGARVSFNLPDGTSGMLNSGSVLSYSIPFSNNRQVKLEGEAWFEVKRDDDHPFEINTGNSITKVLGTSLNLNAYPSENYIEIVLKDGSVEFLYNKGEEKETMLPKERLIFQNGEIIKSVVDPAKYCAWTNGKLIFRGDPMAEVARRIERWYNVKVNIADSELEKYSFRATFEDDKLEDVLRYLCLTSPIQCKITPREIMTDSSFKKIGRASCRERV